MPASDSQIVHKWCTDLVVIGSDVRSLRLSSRVFWEIQRIIGANPKTQRYGLFNHWMMTNYAVSAAIGIRRQLDPDPRSVSLASLLSMIAETICQRPAILSRAEFIRNYRPDLRFAAERQFDRIVGRGADRVNCGQVRRDSERLRSETEAVRRFANRRAAHWDRRSVPKSTLGQLDDALNLMVELVNKYSMILTGNHARLDVTLSPEWAEIFNVPWIPQSPSGKRVDS
jgi:AbiU2